MIFGKNYGAIASILLSSWLLAGCGGKSTTSNPAVGGGGGGGGGATLTLSAPFTNLTGLVYDATTSNSSTTPPSLYTRVFVNSSSWQMVDIQYHAGSEDYLSVIMSAATSIMAGTPTPLKMLCHISGTNSLSLPLCSSWGITINRSAGTISFASTPVFDGLDYTRTGTMNGSLSFPTF